MSQTRDRANSLRTSLRLLRAFRQNARINPPEDMWMLEVCGDTDFLKEPGGAEHRGQLRIQNPYREFAIVFFVAREVNRGHTTGAKLALDSVRGECPLDLFNILGHPSSVPVTSG